MRPTLSPRAPRARGFGAVDLLVTLAFVALVLLVATPAALNTMGSYRRDGAARHVLAQIRLAQSLAVERAGIIALEWGADTKYGRPAGEYRIARDTTGSCGFPAETAPQDGANVIRAWRDLSDLYSGMTIESIRDDSGTSLGGVMFDSHGASVHTCASVDFPVRVTVAAADGSTRTIEIRSAGATRLP